MSFNPSDFAADTDFERLALDRLGTHRVRPADPDMVYHLESNPVGGGSIHVSLGPAEEGTASVNKLRRALQPLGFGAAYKVLDLLIEHVLQDNGAPAGRLTFREKVGRLKSRPARLPTPFDARPELWDRLAALYQDLQEARHAVTHRRAQVTSAGSLAVFDTSRQLVETISSQEIRDFAASVHILAELVIARAHDERRIEIAAWHLNGLQTRHGAANLTAADPMAGRGVLRADLVEVDNGLRFDVKAAREAIERQSRAFWDVELLSANGATVYAGRWEEIPNRDADNYVIDPASLPKWLTEELATS
jgi:hypothetical protein